MTGRTIRFALAAIALIFFQSLSSQTSPNWDGAWNAADTAFVGKNTNTWRLTARKGWDPAAFKATKYYMSPKIPGYWEYLPNGYQTNTTKTYPLIIYFPGCGETNGGNAILKSNGQLLYRYGLGRLFFDENKFFDPGDPSVPWYNPYDSMTFPSLPTLLRNNGNYFSNVPVKTLGQVYPAGGPTEQVIVLCIAYNANPNIPCSGVQEIYPEDIDAAISRAFALYRVDPTRVYMTGMSQGAKSSWFYPASSEANAKKIAATAPVGSVHTAADIIGGGAANIVAGGTRILSIVNRYDLNTNGTGTNAFLINLQSEQAVNAIAKRAILDTFYYDWQISPPFSTSNPSTIHNGWARAYRTDTYEVPFIDKTASTPQRYTLFEWFLTNKAGSVPASCNAPTTPTVTNITQSAATLGWSAGTGNTGYTVEYKKTSDVNWTIAVTNTTLTTRGLTGLSPSTSYSWRVKGICSGGAESGYLSATFTTAGSCGSPASLSTTDINTNAAQLSWGAVAGATTYDVDYKTAASSTWNVAVVGTSATAYFLSGLTEGTVYQWRVKANCSAGSGSFVSAEFTTTGAAPGNCPVPTGLSTNSITHSAAQFSWNWVGASSYTFEYKVSGSPTWVVASTTIQGSSFGLYTLNAGTTYDWRLRSNCGANGSSVYVSSQFSTLTCNSPLSLTASNITSSTAQLSWAAANGASNYSVEYKLSASSTWLIATAQVWGTSYQLSGLQTGSTYDWRVRSNCGNSSGPYASAQFNTTGGTQTCSTPSGLNAVNITTSSASLTWSPVAGAVNYDIEYKLSSSSSWVIGIAPNNTFNITGLNEGAVYDWRVRTNCSVGESSFSTSQFTTTGTTPPPTGNCTAPSNLSSGSITNSSAQFSWTWVGAENYTLEYKPASSASWIVASSTIQGSSFALYNLTAGTSYNWRVKSNCGASGSSAYITASFTTLACPAPTNLNTGSVNSNSAQVSWAWVGGSSYGVEYKTSSASTWTLAAATNPGTSYYFTGLASGTTYNWRVRTNCGSSGSSTYTAGQFITSGSLSSRANTEPGMLMASTGWKLFPIPVRNHLNCSFTSAKSGKAQISITDISGRIIKTETIQVINGANTIRLDLNGIAPGIYILKMLGIEQPLVSKFIKE